MIGKLLGHARVETTARYAHLARGCRVGHPVANSKDPDQDLPTPTQHLVSTKLSA